MRRMPSTLLSRVKALEQARYTRRHADFPPILGFDEWEALAVPSQEQLVFLTREHLTQAAPVSASVVNTQAADHHRCNQEEDRQRKESPREYLKHKQEEVRRATVVR